MGGLSEYGTRRRIPHRRRAKCKRHSRTRLHENSQSAQISRVESGRVSSAAQSVNATRGRRSGAGQLVDQVDQPAGVDGLDQMGGEAGRLAATPVFLLAVAG